jgi:hypothetical protein
MKNKKIKNYVFYGSIVAFVLIFIASSIIFKVYQIEILPSQFFGALIGVFITAIVTAFLLRGQTEGDEQREKSVKVFEKKQEVYHAFLEKFQKIIQSGVRKEDGSIDNTDDLKDLIFQLALIQMHTETKNTEEILTCIAGIKQTLNEFNTTEEEDKNKSLAKYYSELSEKLFEIVTILKADLYDTKVAPISKEKMVDILTEFKLHAEVKEIDKCEAQTYFWEELQKQLLLKGYKFEVKDLSKEVSDFYAKANKNYYYGFRFPVYKTQSNEDIFFKIEIENNYFYGFPNINKKENKELVQIIKQTSKEFKPRDKWYGYKYSDKYKLDFRTLLSSKFKQFKYPRKREILIIAIAEEIDAYIQTFIEIAKKHNL